MKQIIINLLQKTLKEKIKLKKEEIENLIEIPPSYEMGDYAFPCFSFAKKFKQAPNKIAEHISQKIKLTKEIEKVENKGPYINFFVNKELLAKNTITKILKQKDNYGSWDIGKGKKVLIEHTSINPNASPHVGRARNAIIGDSIVRIMKFLNYKTEVHYYINDVSKQIAMLVLAKAERLKFEEMLKEYIKISAKVKNSKETEKKVFDLLLKFEKGDKEVVKKFKKVVDTCVKGQKNTLAELGIKYDFFDYESSYLSSSKNILSKLKSKTFKDKDGRMILDLKGTEIENQMRSPVLVLTRSDGTGLYPLRDIAYTLDKMKKSEKNIIILGEDQKLYFQQIKEALKFLNSKAPEVVHYSFILLSEKGISKKMSTRRGDVILLEDFLKDAIAKSKKEIEKRRTKGDAKKVGIGAVKYAILKNSNNKIIQFNLEDSLNFEGDTGPYLLYSYARASSILRKAKIKSKKSKLKKIHAKEFELGKKLSQFPETVMSAYKNYNPSIIANYSYQLAQIFNEFYHKCPVINSEKEFFRLSLVNAFRQTLKNSLYLLGIEVIEEM